MSLIPTKRMRFWGRKRRAGDQRKKNQNGTPMPGMNVLICLFRWRMLVARDTISVVTRYIPAHRPTMCGAHLLMKGRRELLFLSLTIWKEGTLKGRMALGKGSPVGGVRFTSSDDVCREVWMMQFGARKYADWKTVKLWRDMMAVSTLVGEYRSRDTWQHGEGIEIGGFVSCLWNLTVR